MEGFTSALSGELMKIKEEIETYARGHGLDFHDIIYEVCDFDTISVLAAQGGFPTRYPHWRFGMEYDQLSKGRTYGLQRIYEMVINTNPVYAYLLRANHLVDQKIVMAHVCGHADFFKNNVWFAGTNRKMMDVMANHGTKIRRYMDRHGVEKVEGLIDKALSLENLLDMNELFHLQEKSKETKDAEKKEAEESNENSFSGMGKALKTFLKSKDRQQSKKTPEKKDEHPEKVLLTNTKLPTRDVMRFLATQAPIEEWEADIVGILCDEAYYFLPQRVSKIMNEGWASYWHSTIMTTQVLRSHEIVDYADHHSGVVATSKNSINPYKIGLEIYRDIESRWNTGRFGKDYNECPSMKDKENWDKKMGLGRSQIFEVRKIYNDVNFIDEFLTPELCVEQKLFTTKFNPRTGRMEIDSRDFAAIKQKLLSQLTNFGSPIIEVTDANYNNRGELLMTHVHSGVDLDVNYAADTMKNIYSIWKRPVTTVTHYDDREVLLTFDGHEFKAVK